MGRIPLSRVCKRARIKAQSGRVKRTHLRILVLRWRIASKSAQVFLKKRVVDPRLQRFRANPKTTTIKQAVYEKELGHAGFLSL